MSDGVIIEGKRIIHGQARPLLPAIFENGELQWIMWGERREGDFFPHGGWVHPSDLKGRAWRPWRPREAIIAADGFMVHREGRKEKWFSLGEDEGLRGMVACSEDECRIYIMTTQPPEDFAWARRWPVITKLVQEKKRVDAAPSRLRDVSETALKNL